MTGPQNLSDDLSELIGLFLFHRVEFIVVGAHALALYSRPRFTEDLDLFIRRSDENCLRLQKALQEFGIDLPSSARLQLSKDRRAMIVLGAKPNQVDILNFLDGVEFEPALKNGQVSKLGGMDVVFLSLSDVIATKTATGRPKDIDDLNRLREQLGSEFPA